GTGNGERGTGNGPNWGSFPAPSSLFPVPHLLFCCREPSTDLLDAALERDAYFFFSGADAGDAASAGFGAAAAAAAACFAASSDSSVRGASIGRSVTGVRSLTPRTMSFESSTSWSPMATTLPSRAIL